MNEIEALRAELKCREIVEGTQLGWWQVVKVKLIYGSTTTSFIPIMDFKFDKDDYVKYEFALGILEGKPVFEGDELWHNAESSNLIKVNIDNASAIRNGWFSWNPPKKKTVMIELSMQAVEYYAKDDFRSEVGGACRKALNELT